MCWTVVWSWTWLPISCDVASAQSVTSKFPRFEELHRRLFNIEYDELDDSTHVLLNFSNPHSIAPDFDTYPHSNLLPEFFYNLMEWEGVFFQGGPRFIVEVGSLHGHSALTMMSTLDMLDMSAVPILCIDPFTGDANMWMNYQTDDSVAGWTRIRDGHMLVFDQFMANAKFAASRSGSLRHILPFHTTSTAGARWLKKLGYTPDVVFLDSAHEARETLLEISLYFDLLLPGGVLFGDDYGWPEVRHDVIRFVEEFNAYHAVERAAELQVWLPAPTVLFWSLRKEPPGAHNTALLDRQLRLRSPQWRVVPVADDGSGAVYIISVATGRFLACDRPGERPKVHTGKSVDNHLVGAATPLSRQWKIVNLLGTELLTVLNMQHQMYLEVDASPHTYSELSLWRHEDLTNYGAIPTRRFWRMPRVPGTADTYYFLSERHESHLHSCTIAGLESHGRVYMFPRSTEVLEALLQRDAAQRLWAKLT